MTTSNQLFATELTDGSQFRLYQKISWYIPMISTNFQTLKFKEDLPIIIHIRRAMKS